MLAGTTSALLFRSRNGGESWDPLPFPLRSRAVLHSLLIHPTVRDLYLAGVSAENTGVSGMWRSADGGSTWQPVSTFGGLPVRSIATFRGNPLRMAAGTDSGVFETTDGGLGWSRISRSDNPELQPVVSIAFDPKDANVLYAGTPHLPWKTVDGGLDWRSVHLGMIDDSDIFSIVVDRNRPQRVFAGACSGIYRTLNGGAQWAKLPQSKDASYRTYTLAQDPQYENVLFAGTTNGMIRSPDGGGTWKKIAPYATRSIAFDLSRLGRIFIATDEAGILRSDDNGETWQPANRGFSNRRLSPLAMDDSGTVYAGGSLDSVESAVFVLPVNAGEWSSGRTPAKPLVALAPSPKAPDTLYAATPASVFISRNAGNTWTTAAAPVTENPFSALLATPWASDALLAAAGSSVFISRDSAGTWSERQFPTAIRSLVALDSPWIAAIAESAIYVSRDGDVWEQYGYAASEEIYGIASTRARLFVATTTGLRVSDEARPLRPASGLPEGNTVQAICRHPCRPNVFFAASYNSIFTSVDEGRTWTRMATADWPVESIKQLIVAPGKPDRLLVLTPRQGVFALPLDPEANRRVSDTEAK